MIRGLATHKIFNCQDRLSTKAIDTCFYKHSQHYIRGLATFKFSRQTLYTDWESDYRHLLRTINIIFIHDTTLIRGLATHKIFNCQDRLSTKTIGTCFYKHSQHYIRGLATFKFSRQTLYTDWESDYRHLLRTINIIFMTLHWSGGWQHIKYLIVKTDLVQRLYSGAQNHMYICSRSDRDREHMCARDLLAKWSNLARNLLEFCSRFDREHNLLASKPSLKFVWSHSIALHVSTKNQSCFRRSQT